jgi:transcriptional regulator with XRE-family HTH domain
MYNELRVAIINTFRIIYAPFRIMYKSQLRAARALLSWSQERLAEASGVSAPTIKRLEPGEGPLEARVDTMMKLQRALEAAGVVFVVENGDGPGVRLRKKRE